MATENQTKDESEFVKADEHIFDKERLEPNHRYYIAKKPYPETVDKTLASYKQSSDVKTQHPEIITIKIAHIVCRIIRSFLLIQKCILEKRLSFGHHEEYVDIIHREIQKVIVLFDEMQDRIFPENLVQSQDWIKVIRAQKHYILHLERQLRYYLHNKENRFMLMDAFRGNIIECLHILKSNLLDIMSEDCKPILGILREIIYSFKRTLWHYEHESIFGKLDRMDSQVQSIQTTLGDMLRRFYLTRRDAVAKYNWTTVRSLNNKPERKLEEQDKNRSPSKAQSMAVTYRPESSRRKQLQSFHEMSTVSPSPSHFLEKDELASTLNGAKTYLEKLRQDIITTMRHSVSKHEQQLPSTARETSVVQYTFFSRNKLWRMRKRMINNDHKEDDEENQLNKQKHVIGTNDKGEGADHDQEGRIQFQTKMPTEHESISHIHEPSEFFDSYNSCASLIASLTRVLDEYDSFRKTKYSVVAEPRSLAGTEVAQMANTPIDLEPSSKDTKLRDLTISPSNVHLEEEEASAHCQSSNLMEDFQAASLRESLLNAQKHLTVLKRTQVANQMDLQSKSTDCIDRLQALENTLEFALKSVKVPRIEKHVSPVGLRNQELSKPDEESDGCSWVDNKSSAEFDRDKNDLTFQENDNEQINSSSTPQSSSSTLVSMTLNIPLLESDTIGPLPASVTSLSYSDSGADSRASEDFASQNWLSKNSIVTSLNVLSTYTRHQATQTQCNQEKEPPPPIVSKHWQVTTSFSSAGGTLKTPNSDVSLRVPENAINPGEYVDIHAAVSTDLEFARQLIAMSPDEHIVTPIAEYWAGENFRFDKPVFIIIPHFLPANTDLKMVRVYRLSKLADGRVYFVRIRPLRDVNNSEPRETRIQNQLINSEMEESHKGVTCRLPSEISQDHVHQDVKAKGNLFDVSSKDSNNILSQEHDSEIMVEWDDGSSFLLSSDGKVYVSTTHFSAYVCTYCGHSRESPTLAILACGSRERREDGQQTANILILVGDERIHIVDFQHAYGNGHPKLAERVFPLPNQELQDSSIYMRLRIVGKSREMWSHCQDTCDKIGFPEEQSLPLHGLVSCDNNTCKNIKTKPMVIEWLLESTEGQDPATCLCVVDICHRPDWDCLGSQKMSLTVREITKHRGNALDVTLNNLLALDTADLEKVAQLLEVRESHIEELRQRFQDEQNYRYQLSQKCLSKPDCCKILESLFPTQTAGLNNALSRMSITDNYNCNPSYIHIENTSLQSTNQEPSIQARLRSAQVNINSSAIHTSARQSYGRTPYPERYRTNLPESMHNYLVFTSPEAGGNHGVSTWNQNTLTDTSTPFLITPGNNAPTNNFFNNRLVPVVDRLSSLPPANNEFNISHNSPLNNTSPNCMNQSPIAYQRQLPAVNMEPEDPAQIERALSEIRFDDLSQFPQLSSPTTEF